MEPIRVPTDIVKRFSKLFHQLEWFVRFCRVEQGLKLLHVEDKIDAAYVAMLQEHPGLQAYQQKWDRYFGPDVRQMRIQHFHRAQAHRRNGDYEAARGILLAWAERKDAGLDVVI